MNNGAYVYPYINTYNQQPMNNMQQVNSYDEYLKYLEKEKERIEKSKEQYLNRFQQPTSINQTFQLAPNNNTGIKYVNSIDDVRKETIFLETPFFSKDLSVMWLKNPNGEIKAYELSEIVEKDEKDLQIEFLQSQLNDLKGMINNEQFNSNVDEPKNATNTKAVDDPIGEPIKENKSASIQRVSTSKKKQ